jgi:amino acid adenylation domain-containing protein
MRRSYEAPMVPLSLAQLPFAGNVMPMELDATLTRGLKALSRRHGVTLNMTVLAGWTALSARLSGQEEVVSGSVTELLEGVRARALKAQEKQDLPFEPAVELELRDAGDRVVGALRYATALFDRSTMERHAGYLRRLLTAMVADEQRRVDEIDILGEEERHQLLVGWNDTQASYPLDRCIHELFEEQVAKTPNAVAVIYEGRSLKFAELNGRANQLARNLRGRGVGPNDLVGLYVDRGIEMIVGMLGILKAGGAYIPLDVNYPTERLAQMLRDAAPKVIVSRRSAKSGLPKTPSQLVDLDDGWSEIEKESDINLDSEAPNSHRLAYVIYTSGSTGRPKGVMVEHSSVVNLWCGLEERIYRHHRGCTRIAVNASLSFDASVKQVIQLLSGGCLILVPQEIRLNSAALLEFLVENRVDVLDCTPSQLDSLVSAGLLDETCPIHCVFLIGGEQISSTLWSALARSQGIAAYNVYGPTECTVDATAAAIDQAEDAPTIGKPIENVKIYILDPRRQLLPIGAAGEIYIGGAGVARGYLNRLELTAERFLPDPFTACSTARMYRTGDVGRWRADGKIEYMGRNDSQVKIRGFRIELGEIEACLLELAPVREAVVTLREDSPGEKRLVAYLTVSDVDPAAPNVEELRVYLKAALPEYMVPSAFVILERLPLTPNGKLDRRALPAPELGAYVRREYEALQGNVEEILAGIWQALLKLERVGRQDNFFELGGHSLLIVQMLERLRRVGLYAEIRQFFESPTLAELASALSREVIGEAEVPPNLIPPACEQITPRMLPLVTLEQEHIDRIVRVVPGGAANVKDIYPLAPLQEGILFHHVFSEPGGDAYARILLLSLSSRENLQQLIAALQVVIDRHDILRTAVLWDHLPQAVQVVHHKATLPVEEIRLEEHGDPVDQLRERMRPERQWLDLRQAPLMRLQIAADTRSSRWYALLQTHHLACDNESLNILTSEVIALLEGRAQVLPEPVPYRDHVAQALAHVRTHDTEAFFRSKLGDVDEPTAPFGLRDVRGDGSRIEQAHQELRSELARKLRGQARRLGVSAATLFHAAWGLVVAHTSGRDDVVFGSVLLGRLQGSAGARRILGMFINTLPLRLRLREVTAKGLVEQTQRELVDLLTHEQASLAVAQRCSGVAKSAPLFTALLNYQHSIANSDADWSQSDRLTVLENHGGSNYPMVLSVDDLGEGFRLRIEAFRGIDPHRVLGYACEAVQSLVQALEEAPQTPALALPILPASERRQVVELFNATRAVYPHDKLIHELFEEQVRRTPDAVAISCQERRLTYAQLDRRANQLARFLHKMGVGPDRLVGLCVERGIEMVVGMLGILKAGGAYVPLDLRYPAERIRHILGDSAPVVLLTQDNAARRFPNGATPIIALDSPHSPFDAESGDALDSCSPQPQPHNLAYVIYTSGSTGIPKGVMIEHRSLTNLVDWHCRTFDVRPGSRCSSVAAVGFDAATWEVWPPLTAGGTLVLAPASTTMDPESLLCWWKKESLDVSFLPTPIAELFFSSNDAKVTPRRLLVGGDRLRHCALSESYTLVNNYGPTETTVVATSGTIEQADSVLHIGRPIANTQTYILDPHGRPVPIGVDGELFIGGIGVARGYLNRPDLTAERFCIDPFSVEPRARLYRTGDVCRWRADGTIEYSGRTDEQVKVRGYRIELGEIEAQLMRRRLVKEAVVVVREDTAGEKSLVAYVIPHDDVNAQADLDVDVLRVELTSVLPEYMVPRAFVVLKSFPLTPNGKVDRRALPTPEIGAYEYRQYEEPQGEAEAVLAEIWKSLLGVARVGRRDNFFELGGHSLLAMKAISRMREKLGFDVRVRELFARPVLADFAQGLRSRVSRELPRIVRAARGGDLELSYAQRRLWFLAQMPGVSEAYHIPWAVNLNGTLDRGALRRALDRIVQRHEALRTRFEQVGGQAVQRIESGYASRLDLLEQDIEPDLPQQQAQEALQRLIREEARAPFDLRRGPLIRGRLIRHGQQVHTLLITMHHIVSDGWSMEIFVRELSALYGAYCRGEADPLTPLTVQYADYAVWQRQWLTGPRLEEQRQYWQERLAGTPALLEMPTDRPRPAEQQYTGGMVELVLDEKVTAKLRKLSGRQGTTLYMTLLTGWAVLLSRLSGQEDVVIGTPVASRGVAEIEGLIGFFVNTLALRVDLSGAPTVEALLKRVKECTLGAQEHQDLPFEQLVERLKPVRSLAHSPLFQVMFAWQNAPEGLLELPGVSVSPIASTEYVTAKFDLSLTMSEVGQRIVGGIEYASALYDRTTVERYAEYLKSLLTAMVTNARQNVECIPLLSASERYQVLVEWNATETQYPKDKCIHELIEDQVQRTPDAIALAYEAQQLTYAQLNVRANRLAHYLRELGVKPDTLVTICVERSLEMVVGILGVLKAGGAYVPLDPQYPPERLRYMLGDAAPRVMLTHTPVMQGVHGSWLSELSERVPVLNLSSHTPPWSGEAANNPVRHSPGLPPTHLAYVIYTSGSAGQPKGVMVEHAGAVNLIQTHIRNCALTAVDRVLQFASFGFDASVEELFPPLAVGARAVLRPRELVTADAEFERFIHDQGITVAELPTAFWHQWVGERQRPHSGEGSLRLVVIGGEKAERHHLDAWLASTRRLKSAWLNTYGPTEATVYSCSLMLAHGPADLPPGEIPIGRPVSNTRIYILDRHGSPVPIGVAGEIYIGGAGVARGYLNRPQLTAERFLGDPFSADAHARMYRTGDLGRWRADGNVEYLGRNDFQVKIRGFRIELGEIEARMRGCAGVREAVVLAREDVAGDKRLVAYYNTVTGGSKAADSAERGESVESAVSANALHAHLTRSLPQYMVPVAFVQLEKFPLTANGKLDRKALPAPAIDSVLTRAYAAPAGETEIALAHVWQDILKLERISRHDNFFELGGHSLLATEVIWRLNDRGIDLSVAALFEYPTVRSLANYIDAVELFI